MLRFVRTIGILLAASFAAAVLYNSSASALQFDPGYIISDSIFTNSTSMSANSIQNFINIKGANCANGEAPCLKNFTENGKSAGTIIAEAAQTYSINPQVLITTLQKETGLLTITKPGAWRYRTAMGYACFDNSACESQYFGFTNQVNRAAAMFHRIMIYDPTWYSPYQIGQNYIYYNPEYSCGGSNVTIINRATAALYDYTPYQPNNASLAAGYGEGNSCSSYGNRNFWLYFNDWFGSSISSLLIQSPQSAAVYLQSGNTRFGIPSWDVINAYGLGRFGVTAVSDAYMNSLQDGGTLNTVFSNKAYPGPIYLADNGYRFGFASYQQCIDWGFPSCNNSSYAKALEPSVFDQMYVYGALSPLMLNGSYVYLMKNGEKQAFLSAQARNEKGYGSIPFTPMTNILNSSQPNGESFPQNNSFVSFKGNGTIYAYTNNTFYPLTYDAYKGLSSSNTPVLYDSFSKYTTNPPTAGPIVGSYIGFQDGKNYALSAEKKIDITSVTNSWPSTQSLYDLKTIADRRATDSVAQPTSTYRTTSGTILRIEDGKWRGFYSISDYFALGYNDPIPVSNSILTDLPVGSPIFAPGNGSLYQVNTSGKESFIYTLSTDNTTCQIYSLPQLGLYKFSTSNVYRIGNPITSTTNILSTTTYDENNNLHIVYDGVHSIISAAALQSTWGITNRMNICGLSSKFLNQNTINRQAPVFVRNEHTGVIYYGSNGKKRPIYSYAAFLRMGGNSTNTQNVSMEFLVASPDGVPIYE